MQLDDCPRNRQTKPKTAKHPAARTLALLKGLENARHRFVGNSDPGVADFNDQISASVVSTDIIEHAHIDGSAGGRELAGVLEQVPEDLGHSCAVCQDPAFGCADVYRQLQIFLSRVLVAVILHRMLEQ